MKNKSQGTSKAGEKGSLVIPILNNEYKVIVCWGDPKQVEKVIKDWHHDKADVMLDADIMRGRCLKRYQDYLRTHRECKNREDKVEVLRWLKGWNKKIQKHHLALCKDNPSILYD